MSAIEVLIEFYIYSKPVVTNFVSRAFISLLNHHHFISLKKQLLPKQLMIDAEVKQIIRLLLYRVKCKRHLNFLIK